MAEIPLRIPIVIQVITNEDSIDHFLVDGNVLKKSETCILVEEKTRWKKTSEGSYIPNVPYTEQNNKQSYAVILFDEHCKILDKNHEYNARFFDNLQDAQRYYMCFSPIEKGSNAHD
jgi:hypothetical protein